MPSRGKSAGDGFHFQRGREDFQGFSLLKENDGVDFLRLFSLLKILMVPVIIVQATKPELQQYGQPAPWLQFTVSKLRD